MLPFASFSSSVLSWSMGLLVPEASKMSMFKDRTIIKTGALRAKIAEWRSLDADTQKKLSEDALPEVMKEDDLDALPEPPYVIDRIIRVGDVGVLVAPPYIGKTFLVQEIQRTVTVMDAKFLGHYESVKGSVLYIGQDATAVQYRRQWRKLMKSERDRYNAEMEKYNSDLAEWQGDPDEDGEFPNHGSIHLRPEVPEHPWKDRVNWMIGQGLMIDSPEDVEKIAVRAATCSYMAFEEVEVQYEIDSEGNITSQYQGPPELSTIEGVKLIILDTGRSLFSGESNDDADVGQIMGQLRQLAAALECAIILLIHTNKRGAQRDKNGFAKVALEAVYGSIQWTGAPDWAMILVKSPHDRHTIEGYQIKDRNGAEIESFVYQMKFDETQKSAEMAFVRKMTPHESMCGKVSYSKDDLAKMGKAPIEIAKKMRTPQEVFKLLIDSGQEFDRDRLVADLTAAVPHGLTKTDGGAWKKPPSEDSLKKVATELISMAVNAVEIEQVQKATKGKTAAYRRVPVAASVNGTEPAIVG